MSKHWTILPFAFATAVGFSQEIKVSPDSLKIPAGDTVAVEAAGALRKDTIADNLLPSDLEFIPAEEDDAVIADRLSCLQQTITLDYNDKVQAFINYFTVRDREYTRMVLRRKAVFFPLFEKHLAENNLPDELKYLSIIESGLNPKAVSRARAVGLWQFMSGTGRFMGLRNDWYVDERMDPEKSTIAACKYLTMLYSMFHDWQLALAAYNSGPGTVQRAIRLSGYKKSFWEIYPYLPRETRAYVPQYIAMIYAVNYSDFHNLFEFSSEELPAHDTLATTRPLHFETFAKLTGTCLEDIQRLNPSYQRNYVPGGKTFIIKVPVTAKNALSKNRVAILDSASRGSQKELALVDQPGIGSTYGREMTVYTVRAGDGLGTIALKYNVRIADIQKWNNLSSNLIHPGRQLNIWVVPSTKLAASTPPVVIPAPENGTYIVQPGDTLWDISRKFQGMTIEKLRTLNNLKSNVLKPGQKLIVG